MKRVSRVADTGMPDSPEYKDSARYIRQFGMQEKQLGTDLVVSSQHSCSVRLGRYLTSAVSRRELGRSHSVYKPHLQPEVTSSNNRMSLIWKSNRVFTAPELRETALADKARGLVAHHTHTHTHTCSRHESEVFLKLI
jgi:hypothetical protein